MERKFKLLSIRKISFFLSSFIFLLSITCVTTDSKMLKKHFFSHQREEKLVGSKELLIEMDFYSAFYFIKSWNLTSRLIHVNFSQGTLDLGIFLKNPRKSKNFSSKKGFVSQIHTPGYASDHSGGDNIRLFHTIRATKTLYNTWKIWCYAWQSTHNSTAASHIVWNLKWYFICFLDEILSIVW